MHENQRRGWFFSGLLVLTSGCGPKVTSFTEDPTVLELRHAGTGEESVGNFVGRIPCATCEKIKIVLSLFQNAADASPARYQLERIGEDGNARITTRGGWTRSTGRPGDPNAPVIALDENTPARLTRFLSIDDRLLLMLDDQNTPLVSNGAWSYTLNSVPIEELDALTPTN
jgi:hypothetical protein